jgi:hypothetical protein
MARAISDTVDILVARIRQSNGIAVTDDIATQVLTLSQSIVNIALQRITITETFTTAKQKLLYPITDLTTAVDILSMVESNRPLTHCTSLNQFSAYETNWFRNITATRFEAWHQIGRSLFILYPAKAAASSVVITSIKNLTIYADYSALGAATMELPDEDVEIALEVAELILLVRRRKPQFIKTAIELITTNLKTHGYVLKS